MTNDSEQWRDVSPQWRSYLIASTTAALQKRYAEGHDLHGPLFHGDPIVELKTEVYDTIFYAEKAQDLINHLRRENESLRRDNAQLRRELNGPAEN